MVSSEGSEISALDDRPMTYSPGVNCQDLPISGPAIALSRVVALRSDCESLAGKWSGSAASRIAPLRAPASVSRSKRSMGRPRISHVVCLSTNWVSRGSTSPNVASSAAVSKTSCFELLRRSKTVRSTSTVKKPTEGLARKIGRQQPHTNGAEALALVRCQRKTTTLPTSGAY